MPFGARDVFIGGARDVFISGARDVAASNPFKLLLRAAETLRHNDGHVGGASTSRVALAPVDKHITFAASSVAPLPVVEYIAPGPAVPCAALAPVFNTWLLPSKPQC